MVDENTVIMLQFFVRNVQVIIRRKIWEFWIMKNI